MTVRDSVLYDKLHVKKYVGDSRDRGGRVVPIPFEHTVVTGELSGDDINLCVLPANCEVVDMFIICASTLGTASVSIGDAGDIDRFLLTQVFTLDIKNQMSNSAGMRFRPTADTIVFGRYSVANPTVGGILRGCFQVVPGA